MKKTLLFFAIALMTALSFAQTLTPIGTENKGKHVKFIIAADGFTSGQMSTFESKALTVKNAIMNLEPYKSNPTKINFYRDNTVSTESGYSILAGTGQSAVTKDTYFDLYTNKYDMDHFYGFSASTRTQIENRYSDEAGGNRVFLIIISNNPNYAGYGDFPSFPTWNTYKVPTTIISVNSTYMTFLAMHELGHSFADLDDEYVDAVFAATGDPILSHSNRLNIKDSNPGGWLEGGKYVATGKWRYGNGLMKSATWSFHSRNEGLVQDRIDAEALTIVGTSFSLTNFGNSDIDVACGQKVSNTKYHDGSASKPAIGDYIYTNVHGTAPFNGGGLWRKSGSDMYRIASDGEVLAKVVNHVCGSGLPD